MRRVLILFSIIATLPLFAGLPTKPNDKEWNLISADYTWLETLRKAQPAAPPNATRKQQIETLLENYRKIKPTYDAFLNKAEEYYLRTGDARAAQLMAKDKIAMADDYMNVLSRYDRALELYREAQQLDPSNADVAQRIASADAKRFVSMNAFAGVKSGMKEDEVRKLVGLPREDWIKQVVQNNRVFSVWIYPKSDGGASAIYFDNGVVYHTNWNAAAPPAQAAAQTK